MKNQLRVALICGGPSLERGISLNSARSVLDHLGGDGVEIVPIYFDHKKRPYEISRDQLYSNTPSDFDFKLQETARPLSQTALKQVLKSCDIAFPAMHGTFGEDGGIQRLLERFKVPYIGSDEEACKRCFDKFEANEFIRSQGFYTLPSTVLKINSKDNEEVLRAFFKEHDIKRAIVKPATGGSSIGVFSVETAEEALEKVQLIFSKRMDTRVVIEPFCEGIEFTVIVLQNRFGMPVAVLPTEMEIDYRNNQVFDYRMKYLPSRQVKYHCPPRFDNPTIERIQVQAEQLFVALGMRDFSRFDGWLMPDGNVWFSDFNPISGMEQNSFLFQQSSRIGMSHRDLLRMIVSHACERNGIEFVKFDNERRSSDSGQAYAKKPVNVLFGGDTSERQVSLMSGTNAWLKLKRSKKYEPKPFLLDLNGDVWEVPYALTLNHTVEEVLENCENAAADEERLQFLEEKVRLRLGLDESFYSEPFFLPRKMNLSEFVDESDFVFIGLHGGQGEDGRLQARLDKAGISYNGSGPECSAICMDKYETGKALAGYESEGILTCKKAVFEVSHFASSGDGKEWELLDYKELWDELVKKLGSKTFIVKPRDEGCSSGIVRLYRAEDLQVYVEFTQKGASVIPPGHFKNQMNPVEMPINPLTEIMLENFVETDRVRVKGNKIKWTRKTGWVEMTIGVLAPSGHEKKEGKYHAMNPSLTIAEGEVLSVEEKFQGGTGVNMTPPPREYISDEVLSKIKRSSEKVAKLVGIEGYCRIDLFIHVESGDVIVIEVNTTPALTPSTVIYHQALCEKNPMYPTEFLESLIENKGY
jgi:D-alanine--D-alanine ligase